MDANAGSQNINAVGSSRPSTGGEGSNNRVANKGKRKVGGKVPGPEWQFAENVRSFIDWRCKLCGKEKSRGAPRIREHFLGSGRSGASDRENGGRCNGIGHENATKRLRELLGGVANAKRPRILVPSVVTSEHHQRTTSST